VVVCPGDDRICVRHAVCTPLFVREGSAGAVSHVRCVVLLTQVRAEGSVCMCVCVCTPC